MTLRACTSHANMVSVALTEPYAAKLDLCCWCLDILIVLEAHEMVDMVPAMVVGMVVEAVKNAQYTDLNRPVALRRPPTRLANTRILAAPAHNIPKFVLPEFMVVVANVDCKVEKQNTEMLTDRVNS